jgi:hypothetical protein
MNRFVVRFLLLTAICLPLSSVAQESFVPLWNNEYHTLDRHEIQSDSIYQIFHSSVKPYMNGQIYAVPGLGGTNSILSIDSRRGGPSEKPILKHFYKDKANLFEVHTKDFDLYVNPVLHFESGSESAQDEMYYINSRGLEVSGQIDGKVGFYTYLTDNQLRPGSFALNRVGLDQAVAHEGFYKPFKDGSGIDLISATGYITFQATKHIGVQFGQERNFIGNGHRSLFLSDYGNSYPFLKVNTKIWRLNYQNLFAQMTGQHLRWGPDIARPKKFAAMHHLSFNAAKNLNIGLFEAVIFGQSNYYEFQYLNPIIFYRFVEQDKGSPDNAFMGLDAKWNLFKKWSLYGQVLLDELNFAQLRDSTGWWGNKFGFQAGAKYINAFGIDNLDLQGEMNIVRPYTYTHLDGTSNYTHYNQPIAHPLGANFTELIGIIRYRPHANWRLYAQATIVDLGADTTGSEWITYSGSSSNWGGNIFLPYTTREQEYNNKVGQGYSGALIRLDLRVSWEIRRNLFMDVRYLNRRFEVKDLLHLDETSLFTIGLRLNSGMRIFDF